MSSPVLIFGGSFDPPTTAHRILPIRAAQLLGSHRVIYVPAAVSPHKLDAPPLDAGHRLAMLERAIDGQSPAEIDRVELEREGPSYMVDTVHALRERIDDGTPLRLLIGDDQAVSFHRWKDWREIMEIAEPSVLPRLFPTPETFADGLRAAGVWSDGHIRQWCHWRLDLPIMDVEATIIRNRIQTGQSVDDLLPAAVEAYVRAHDLYRASS